MDKNRRYDFICLGTPQPGLTDGLEGLRGASSWGHGGDGIITKYAVVESQLSQSSEAFIIIIIALMKYLFSANL